MSTGTIPAFSLITTQQRRVPRYKLTIPLNLTVLRSGIPDNIPGRTLEIGEGGMGVVVASKLLLGESVRVEFLLPHTTSPVRATAVVRYQHEKCFGLQFLRLPVEQQSTIRYWTRSEGEVLLAAQPAQVQEGNTRAERATTESPSLPTLESYEAGHEFPRRRIALLAVLVVLVGGVGAWWQWQQEYAALEAQIPAQEAPVLKPQLRVPPNEMQRRIKHRATPEYPDAARGTAVQGTVVLNAVIGPDGNVGHLKFVSGPELLSRAAMDAVRWWRYEPYLINGQPVTVETTVAVDFR
jgi:TonB family protein